MFAINHAAAALILKRRYPTAPLVWLLVSVQLMELAWVAFNYLGIERTTTADVVRYVGDIQLAHMPWSHSLVTMLGVAVLAWLVIAKGAGKSALGVAVAVGIASHLVLDLMTHQPDIQLAPGISAPRLGSGIYAAAPIAAFLLELAFGVLCWWIYRGGKALLATIVVFNLANLSLFVPAIPGPEGLLVHRPILLTTLIFGQIVVTLVLVGVFAGEGRRA